MVWPCRFNDVSDASSLRAIAELTSTPGAFLGAVAIEPSSAGALCYRRCVERINAMQAFRSVLAGSLVAAIDGAFGPNISPALREATGDDLTSGSYLPAFSGSHTYLSAYRATTSSPSRLKLQ